MASPANLSTELGKALSVDFVQQFGKNINDLKKFLGVQRIQKLASGSVIRTYKSTVTLDGGVVEKGDIIPLSKVKMEPDATYELAWKKYRKAVAMEDIQTFGYQQACIETDNKLIRQIQRNIRTDFLAQLNTGTGILSVPTLKSAFAKAWVTVQTIFEDDAVKTIAFVNPADIGDHIIAADLTTQTAFGLKYLQDFAGIDVVVISPTVASGTVYATAADNLILAYADMAGGEIDKVFDFMVEETGLIGVAHDTNNQTLSAETVAAYGLKLFAERTDGIAVLTIDSAGYLVTNAINASVNELNAYKADMTIGAGNATAVNNALAAQILLIEACTTVGAVATALATAKAALDTANA